MYCPVYTTQLVRSSTIRFSGKANSSRAACDIVASMLADSPNEQLVVIMLDTKLNVIGASVVTSGTLDASLVHPREVYRPAILANAASIIIAHNHPSGDPAPSSADWQVYERCKQAGQQLGISCLDSIVVGFNLDGTVNAYSMAESGAVREASEAYQVGEASDEYTCESTAKLSASDKLKILASLEWIGEPQYKLSSVDTCENGSAYLGLSQILPPGSLQASDTTCEASEAYVVGKLEAPTRQALEAYALNNCCACVYYELADTIEAYTDSELLALASGACCNCGEASTVSEARAKFSSALQSVGRVLGTFSKAVDGGVSINFSTSGSVNCDDSCKAKGVYCYAERTESRYDRQQLLAKLRRHEVMPAWQVCGAALLELQELKRRGQVVRWVRVSSAGSLPQPAQVREDKLFRTQFRALLAYCKREAIPVHIPVHIPVESNAKARFYRALVGDLATIRESLHDTRKAVKRIGAVSIVAGTREDSMRERVTIARDVAKARYESTGRKTIVCPAVVASFNSKLGAPKNDRAKCGSCTACSNPLFDIVYPLHEARAEYAIG